VRLVLVEWEDIVGVGHQAIPKHESDLKQFELVKQTTGFLIEFANHYVIVTDYDVTHEGEGYCHNDFTIIPKGAVRNIRDLYMTEAHGDRPLYGVGGKFDRDLPTDDTVARD